MNYFARFVGGEAPAIGDHSTYYYTFSITQMSADDLARIGWQDHQPGWYFILAQMVVHLRGPFETHEAALAAAPTLMAPMDGAHLDEIFEDDGEHRPFPVMNEDF